MRRTAALLLLTLAVLVLTPPAQAGGPTSVMITSPSDGRATGLYHDDKAYAALSELVGVGARVDRADAPPGVGSGSFVSLTWLVHDVQPWRIDRVYADADGGAWIATQEDTGNGVYDAEPVWHRAPAALSTLLDRVLDVRGGGAVAAPPMTAAPLPAPVDAEPVAAPDAPPLLAVALLVGLLGVALGVAGTLVAGRQRARRTEPQTIPAAVPGLR